MPDRAVVAMLPTFALAFICGVIGAVYEMHGSAAFWLGFAGSVGALIAGLVSVIRTPGATEERLIVAGLRALLDVALFVTIYLGLLEALRDAKLFVALLLFVVAGACALVLARLRVRDDDELRGAQPRPH